jgi:hypothetical protein
MLHGSSDCAPLSMQIREAAGSKLPPGARVGGVLVRCPAIVHTRHRDFVLNLRVRNRSRRTFLLVLPVDPVVAPCDVLAVLAGRPLSGAFSCGQRGTVTTVSKPLRRQPLPNSTAGLPVERRVRCLQPNS